MGNLSAEDGKNHQTTKEPQIQFAARASMHDPRYLKPYLKIPKAAWEAYHLERLLGKLMDIIILEITENNDTRMVMALFNRLTAYQGTARIVLGKWHDLDVGKYYIIRMAEVG